MEQTFKGRILELGIRDYEIQFSKKISEDAQLSSFSWHFRVPARHIL
jgi:hypothetical protein